MTADGCRTFRVNFHPEIAIISIDGTLPWETRVGRGTRNMASFPSLVTEIGCSTLMRMLDASGPVWNPGM